MRTEQAGVKAGSKAGGEAGSKAGGEAGSKAGGKAGSKAGGEAGSKAGGKAGRVYNDVGAASETDATSGSQKGKGKKKKRPPPKCGFCETITEKQCGNYRRKGGACDEHLQHRWLNGRFSTSADWLEEDEFIKWGHPTGRGNWCRSCHLLHKASFKEFPEKKDLRKWQLDSPSHDAEFKAAHKAYVTVRRAGGVWKPNEHPRTMFQQEIGGRVRRPYLIYPDTAEGRKALWDRK